MSWPTRSIRDPETKLSALELDREKDRARNAMWLARDAVILRTRTTAERAYTTAHLALLACQTEGEVARVEQAYLASVVALQEAIDAKRA